MENIEECGGKIRKKSRNVVLTNIKGGAIIVNVRGKQSSHL